MSQLPLKGRTICHSVIFSNDISDLFITLPAGTHSFRNFKPFNFLLWNRLQIFNTLETRHHVLSTTAHRSSTGASVPRRPAAATAQNGSQNAFGSPTRSCFICISRIAPSGGCSNAFEVWGNLVFRSASPPKSAGAEAKDADHNLRCWSGQDCFGRTESGSE